MSAAVDSYEEGDIGTPLIVALAAGLAFARSAEDDKEAAEAAKDIVAAKVASIVQDAADAGTAAVNAAASANLASSKAQDASAALDSTVTARDAAIAARTAAQGARDTAITARDAAAGSATAAAGSATSASGSAGTATTKAGEASTSAGTATTKAAEAVAARDTAVGARDTAVSARDTAVSAKDTAVGSATTATTKAGEASTSATTATTKAGEASTSAATATTKAGEASTSAATATTKAGEASTSAATATTKAAEAATSALSIAGGPVTSVNGKTGIVTLDPLNATSVRPSLDLQFTGPEAIDPAWLTRATTGLQINPNGFLESRPNNAIRIDHDPVTGQVRGVLVEETRINQFYASQDFTAASWNKGDATCPATTAVLDPFGGLNASKLTENSANASHYIIQGIGGMNAAVRNTFSIFARMAERSKLYMQIDDGTTAGGTGFVDLATGAVTTIGGPGTPKFSVVPFALGWWRICLSAVPGTGAVVRGLAILVNGAGLNFYTGDGSSGLYVFGAMLEVGSQPSSYIATTNTQLTRNTDQLRVPTAGWFNPREGTHFVDYYTPDSFVAGDQRCALGFGTDFVQFMHSDVLPTQVRIDHGISGGEKALGFMKPSGNRVRIVGSYNGATLRGAMNGSAVQSIASVQNFASISQMYIGAGPAGYAPLMAPVSRVMYFPKALSDIEIQKMSAL